MTEKDRGGARDAAPKQKTITIGSSATTNESAKSTARPRLVVTFTPGAGVDAIRSLRLLRKAAKRRFGLVAIDAYEDRTGPLPILNKFADEFRRLADEVIAGRAEAWRSR